MSARPSRCSRKRLNNPRARLSTRLITTSSRSSTPSKRTRPANGRSSSAGSAICSRCPFSPAPANCATAALNALERRQKIADQHQLPGARQRLESRQSAFGVASPGRRSISCDQPAQRDAAGHRRDAAAEQRQPLAAAHQQARQRHQDQFGPVALGRPVAAGDIPGRAVIHRGGRIAPQPYALRRLPFGFADIEALRLGAFAPVDAGGGVARLVLAELPECLALPDPAAAVHALRHGRGDPLGGDQQRRQRARRSARRGRAAAPPPDGAAPESRRWSRSADHRSGAAICSIT